MINSIAMKQLVFLCCILSSITLGAQQYTYLYFEDKNGLRDSLAVVTDLSDEQIAEIPVYSDEEVEQAFNDSTYWVIMGQGIWPQVSNTHTYAYKAYTGIIESQRKDIIFPANRLPVTISWNQQFFIDNGLVNSIMSDMGAWFDVACRDADLYMVLLSDSNTCTTYDTYDGEGCSYSSFGSILVKHIGIAIGAANNPIEGIDNILISNQNARKLLHNGQLFIERNGRMFTVTGMEIE